MACNCDAIVTALGTLDGNLTGAFSGIEGRLTAIEAQLGIIEPKVNDNNVKLASMSPLVTETNTSVLGLLPDINVMKLSLDAIVGWALPGGVIALTLAAVTGLAQVVSGIALSIGSVLTTLQQVATVGIIGEYSQNILEAVNLAATQENNNSNRNYEKIESSITLAHEDATTLNNNILAGNGYTLDLQAAFAEGHNILVDGQNLIIDKVNGVALDVDDIQEQMGLMKDVVQVWTEVLSEGILYLSTETGRVGLMVERVEGLVNTYVIPGIEAIAQDVDGVGGHITDEANRVISEMPSAVGAGIEPTRVLVTEVQGATTGINSTVNATATGINNISTTVNNINTTILNGGGTGTGSVDLTPLDNKLTALQTQVTGIGSQVSGVQGTTNSTLEKVNNIDSVTLQTKNAVNALDGSLAVAVTGINGSIGNAITTINSNTSTQVNNATTAINGNTNTGLNTVNNNITNTATEINNNTNTQVSNATTNINSTTTNTVTNNNTSIVNNISNNIGDGIANTVTNAVNAGTQTIVDNATNPINTLLVGTGATLATVLANQANLAGSLNAVAATATATQSTLGQVQTHATQCCGTTQGMIDTNKALLLKIDAQTVANGTGIATANVGIAATGVTTATTLTNVNSLTTTFTTFNTAWNIFAGNMDRLRRWLWNDRAIAIANLIMNVHTGVMLSRSLADTVGSTIDISLQALGFNLSNSEGEVISFGEVVGNSLNQVLINAVGLENSIEIRNRLATFNRIYTSSMNTFYNIHSIFDSARNIAETTATNVAFIGNALRNSGVVGSNEYRPMNTDFTPWGQTNSRWEKLHTGVEDLENKVAAMGAIAGETISIGEAFRESVVARKEVQVSLAQVNNGRYGYDAYGNPISVGYPDFDELTTVGEVELKRYVAPEDMRLAELQVQLDSEVRLGANITDGSNDE